jgi:hypothetical protein
VVIAAGESGRYCVTLFAIDDSVYRREKTMDLAALQQRIARGEDLHTELKEWPIHPDSLAAALVAWLTRTAVN